jgi:hypothetical protein
MVPGGEYLHAHSKFGGKVELSCVEHPPIESQEASAAYKKGLNSAVLKEIELHTYWTSSAAVGIRALAIGLLFAYQR